MAAVTFTSCTEEWVPAVRAFFSRVYRNDYVLAGDEALLRWQFRASGAGCHLKLALADGAIAACLGYIPAEISVCGRKLRGAWTANWVVDPGGHSAGLGLRLMLQLVNEFDVTLVAGASAQARSILPQLGFTSFGELARYVCVLDAAGTGALTRSNESMWRSMVPPASVEEGTECLQVDAFDGSVEQVWDALWGRDGAGTRRSAAYLNWRYAAHPRFAYRMFVAGDPSRPDGFAVHRIETADGCPVRVGRLVEFVAQPSAEDALLAAVISDARAHGASLLDYFCASTRLAGALTRGGWLPEDALPAPVPVLLQPIARGRRGIPFLGHLQKASAPADIHFWYVTKGDGDQDRPN